MLLHRNADKKSFCVRGSCSCAATDANIDIADLNINTALQNCGDRRPCVGSNALARNSTLLSTTRAMAAAGSGDSTALQWDSDGSSWACCAWATATAGREEGGTVEAARLKLMAGVLGCCWDEEGREGDKG